MQGGHVRATLTLAVALALGALATGVAATAVTLKPVIKLKDPRFGNILATPKHQALYYWNVERKDFKVHCTGSCAKAWPPLIVRSSAVVPALAAGIQGRFGVVKRPDGKLQVTYNRLPIYTYAHEGPNQVLCDNVNGWFVVRL
jgi:predicted lipoprotein with Yx(FWY)xxD motif